MENTIRFIINADGTHKVSNRGILRALSQYDTKLYIITPLPLETSIRVNYLIHERHDIRSQQYLTPVVNMKGCDLVSELESIYQEVADWNVFGCSINPLAYSKISKYRSGRIGISFTISQVLNVEGNPNLTNYKGLIGSNGDIPSGTYQNGDYFECDTFNFFSQTLNKRLTQGSIAYFKDNAWHELERFEVIKNTTTEIIQVDPAALAETPEASEETINEIIANYTGAVAETVDKVDYLDTAVQELDNKKLNKIWADITEQTTTNLTDILVFNRGSNVYKTTIANLLDHVAVVELFTVVAELPEIGVPNKIYLVPSSDPETQNTLDEFIWVDNDWERIGGISVDLSNYFNKPEIISMLGGKQDKLVAGDNITINPDTNVISASGGIETVDWQDVENKPELYNKTEINSMLDGKVDEVSGKGLSTNDYTNADKQSVEKIPTIEQDILDLESDKADKSELFSGDYDDLINKPTIPTKVSELTNDKNYVDENFVNQNITDLQSKKADKTELFSGSYNDLEDKPTIPAKTSELVNDSEFVKKDYVDSKVSSVYKYKGSVSTFTDLPKTNRNVGDVYDVQDSGMNYAWSGTVWDELGGYIDLSNYYSKDETFSQDEINYLLGNKASLDHNHDNKYAKINHDHDDAYYQKRDTYTTVQVNNLLLDYSKTNHNHDTEYYKKADTYSKTQTDTLLNGKSNANHNHDTKYANINHNHDTKYADINHNHNTEYYQKTETYNKTEIDEMIPESVEELKLWDTTLFDKLLLFYGGWSPYTIVNADLGDLSTLNATESSGGMIKAMAVDDTYIYIGDASETVKKYLKEDLSFVAESPDFGGYISTIAIDDTYIYVGGGAERVKKYLKSDLSYIGQSPMYGNSGNPIQSIAIDDTYIYAGGYAEKVSKYLKSDLSHIGDTYYYGGSIYSIALDDNYIYVGGYITRTVRKYLKSDLSYIGETPNYGGEINTIAIDDTHIYVGGATTNTVRKYLKSDLSFVGETENYGGFIYSIVVYDNYLYVGGYATQRVRKYLKTDLSYVAESPDYDGAIRVIAIG